MTHSVITVDVGELWKGTTPKQITLYQPLIGRGINFHEAIGTDYVIFARVLTPELRALSNLPRTTPPGYLADYCSSKPTRLIDLTVSAFC